MKDSVYHTMFDLFNAILAPSKFVNFKKICIVVMNVVMSMMTLLVPAESVMLTGVSQ